MVAESNTTFFFFIFFFMPNKLACQQNLVSSLQYFAPFDSTFPSMYMRHIEPIGAVRQNQSGGEVPDFIYSGCMLQWTWNGSQGELLKGVVSKQLQKYK